MWIITKVHDKDCQDEVGTKSHDFDKDKWETLPEEQKIPFQMLVDETPPDSPLIYEGLIDRESYDEDGFQPLDDFGLGNYGCTEIRYKDREGNFRPL